MDKIIWVKSVCLQTKWFWVRVPLQSLKRLGSLFYQSKFVTFCSYYHCFFKYYTKREMSRIKFRLPCCSKCYTLDTRTIYKYFLNILFPFLGVNIVWTSWSDNKFKCPILFRSYDVSWFFNSGGSYSSLKRIFKTTLTYYI